MRLIAIRLLAFVVSGVLACAQAPSPQEIEKQLGTLKGRTVNALTGEPVRRTKLTLRRSDSGTAARRATPTTLSAVSDDDGRFVFESLEPGRYALFAERVGFVRQQYGARSAALGGTPLELSPRQQIPDLEFKLIPQGVITGRVIDEEGEPVARATIMVAEEGRLGGRQQMGRVGGAATNDIGEFRIANLTPGRYVLAATYRGGFFGPGRLASGEEPPETYFPTFYPSATDPAAAVSIEVGAGQEISGIQIRLQKGHVYRVQGRVVSASPALPPDRIRVTLSPRDRAMARMMAGARGGGRVRPDGSFEITNVLPGAYHLVALQAQQRPVALGRLAVDVTNGDVEGLVLQVGEPVEVAGHVRVEGQDTVSLERVRVALAVVDGIGFGASGDMGFMTSNASVKPDGSFRIEAAPRDRFYLNFSGLPENTYVRSVRVGNTEVLDQGLDLSQAGSPVRVEVILSAQASTVEGVVMEDGKPALGGWVMLLPDPERPAQSYLRKTAQADQNGRFAITGVAPGEYKVYAWAEPQYELLRDPEAVKPFAKEAVSLTVGEGAVERTELEVLSLEPPR